MSKLNYHHLQYFYAIAKHGSIAKAARSIFVTPQTLSAQLNTLEEQLGFALFERRGKRLILNDMGHITFSYAEDIFNLGDELIHSLKNHSTNFTSRFAIGVTDVIPKVFSFNFLKEIYSMDDSIKLICKETSLEVLLGELAVNKLDAVLSDQPLPSGSPIKAYSHLVGKTGMSFFAHTSVVDQLRDGFPNSLHKQRFFTAGEGSHQRVTIRAWFKELGITPIIIGEFDDSILTKYFAQAAYGCFCAPTIIENHVLEHFDVGLIGRTNKIKERYYLISPERKVSHLAVRQLLNQGKKLFNQPIH